MNTQIKSFDFTRVLCTLGIICFHFSCHTDASYKPFYIHANGDWGTVFVVVFFILSGGLLYQNNPPDNFQLRIFYYKRWKSVFPSFYIVWVGFYIISILLKGSLDLNKPNANIIYSILGIDGYVQTVYGIQTFYFVGEWFLGAIIICYIFMPFLICLSKKYDLLTTMVLLIILIWSIKRELFDVDVTRNILTCLFCMQIGIVLIKRNIWRNKYIFLISILITLVTVYVALPISSSVLNILLGTLLFIVLSYSGNYIMKIAILDKTISNLSRYSFTMYLLHHVIIICVLTVLDVNNWMLSGVILLLIIGLTIIAGWILSKVTSAVLSTNFYKRMEKWILK